MNRSVFFFVCFVFSFLFGCDDAQQMVSPVIDGDTVGVVETPFPSVDSRYSAILHRVSDVERFGSGVYSPVALEWNGSDFYMLAEHGYHQSAGQYLFKVDRYSGVAEKVNPGARDLGGSFAQGRTFTQVFHVYPRDLAWSSLSSRMFAACFVIDKIVSIDIESGLADRITDEKISYCLEGDERVPQVFAFAHDGIDFYASSKVDNFSSEIILSRVSSDFSCLIPIAEIRSSEAERIRPISMCWDGKAMYLSENNMSSLYLLDLETGDLHVVGKWVYGVLPPGHFIQDKRTGEDSELTRMP